MGPEGRADVDGLGGAEDESGGGDKEGQTVRGGKRGGAMWEPTSWFALLVLRVRLQSLGWI
jgi:hypothetical protein